LIKLYKGRGRGLSSENENHSQKAGEELGAVRMRIILKRQEGRRSSENENHSQKGKVRMRIILKRAK
jgi:hypothetical protein